ncbi:calcium-binding protein [Planktotalea sp.]|uniref:calcium-binding protein n=1 Tax=Planktotalea sp. TaxID=2029877 RepID=UPI003D6BDCDD
MTTYTLTGFSLLWTDTNGDGEDDHVAVGSSQLDIVLRDNDTSFTYDILVVPEDPNELPSIQMQDHNPYHVLINGVQLGQNAPASIGEIHWNPDNIGQFLSFFTPDGLNHVFHMNGDDLDISTPEDLLAFDAVDTYLGVVLEDGWTEGDEIEFADLADVSITEADMINGDAINDTFYGGLGKDTISGGKGKDKLYGGKKDDILAGNKGYDKLYGQKGDDLLEGGKGKDTLDGGFGDDVMTGGTGDDTFIFRAEYGSDTITDFDNNNDTLRLEAALWTGDLSVADVLSTFATDVTDGDFDGVLFDFGDEQLYVNGIGVNGLNNDLEII